MADVKISALPAATTPLAGTELVPVVQGGLTKQVAASELAPVQSVAGKTGTVTLAKGDVGLSNVDNTSDVNKPVSTAQQTAIDAKVSKTGDTMTGPLSVPAGASGTQVPQAQEVGGLATTQLGLAGQVGFFARDTAPTGWLKANGAAVSRTTYANLFAAIGTTFGAGDGSTTFTLPDMRGEFPRGWDDGRGVDSGRAFGSAQSHAFASHTHTYGTQSGASGSNVAADYISRSIGANDYGARNTSSTGGTETRPRNIALLACIKF